MNIALIEHPCTSEASNTAINDQTKLALLQQGRLVEVISFDTNWVGNIYQGRVNHVSANFIFVDIGTETAGFLPNQKGMNTLKQGDYLTVQVKRNPSLSSAQKKGPLLTLLGEPTQQATQPIGLVSRPCVVSQAKTLLHEPLDKIVISNPDLVDNIATQFPNCQIECIDTPFTAYEIAHKLPAGPKVWLKSGAYLLIEKTTACTVIDINTGKHTHKKKNIIHQTNTEAIAEIAYQLRLQGISGIVIIDLINNPNKSENQQLVEKLKQLLATDRAQTQVMGITKLGLLELTRQSV